MNQERVCLDCGTPLQGRADKKFCNDLGRNNYNNQLTAIAITPSLVGVPQVSGCCVVR
ncbi:hypothetical protein [Mucilaginibacter oryzae]|uniref:hypothetical protein n=1 Tax=Mucilaginibacter oryzae TaxID=468058 RepID=UPI00147274DC|nr:hypothetical protein [Mucilaginibacter oryzae]